MGANYCRLCRGVAQSGSALEWGSRGRKFKSSRPDQIINLFHEFHQLVTVYVLKGKTGKRYVGITNNLSRRLNEHRSRRSKAGQLLGQFDVLFTETFPDYKSARIKEKFLKSGQGRKWLNDLDSGSEPARGG